MKFLPLSILVAFIVVHLTSCGSRPGRESIVVLKQPGFNPNHGPFDSNGDYVESWANNPPKRIYVTREELAKNPKLRKKLGRSSQIRQADPINIPVEPIGPIASHTPPRVKQQTYKPKRTPTIKPKPRTVKVKPKRKPPIIHTVKKGDTLYSLSRRYKSGVKTIMIANGLKNSVIRIGQKLKIPRY